MLPHTQQRGEPFDAAVPQRPLGVGVVRGGHKVELGAATVEGGSLSAAHTNEGASVRACRALHQGSFGDAQQPQARVGDGGVEGVEPILRLVGVAECSAEPLALCGGHTSLVGHRGSALGGNRRLARIVERNAAALGCAANELYGK
eukprot:scaffold119575_cov63-Phaeocystis_antarctica.AAC.2